MHDLATVAAVMRQSRPQIMPGYEQQAHDSSAVGACREHPEVSEALCVEMMTRQLGDEMANSSRKVVVHQVLMCLAPWMQNISLNVRWEGMYPSMDA